MNNISDTDLAQTTADSIDTFARNYSPFLKGAKFVASIFGIEPNKTADILSLGYGLRQYRSISPKPMVRRFVLLGLFILTFVVAWVGQKLSP